MQLELATRGCHRGMRVVQHTLLRHSVFTDMRALCDPPSAAWPLNVNVNANLVNATVVTRLVQHLTRRTLYNYLITARNREMDPTDLSLAHPCDRTTVAETAGRRNSEELAAVDTTTKVRPVCCRASGRVLVNLPCGSH